MPRLDIVYKILCYWGQIFILAGNHIDQPPIIQILYFQECGTHTAYGRHVRHDSNAEAFCHQSYKRAVFIHHVPDIRLFPLLFEYLVYHGPQAALFIKENLGIDCQYYTDYYLQRIAASSLHQDDTVIAISYSGQSKDVVDTVKTAKKAGAKVVVITNFEQTLLEKWGDVVLKSSQKQLLYGDAIFSRTTQMALIDMLYMGIILSDYEKYTHQLDKSSKVVRDKAYS